MSSTLKGAIDAAVHYVVWIGGYYTMIFLFGDSEARGGIREPVCLVGLPVRRLRRRHRMVVDTVSVRVGLQ